MTVERSLRPRNLSIAASSKARSEVNSWAPSVRPLVYVIAAMSFGAKCRSMNWRAALTTTFVRSGLTLRSSSTITYKRPLMGCALDRTSLTDGIDTLARAVDAGSGISTSENASMSCGFPSSSNSKSAFVRSGTKLPRWSVTTASMST